MSQPTPQPGAAAPGAADLLPEFLAAIAGVLPPESVDQLWLFPVREAGKTRSVVAVAAAFERDAPDRRRVITAQRTLRPDDKGRLQTTDSVVEHGSAPLDRLERVVDGVLRRLSDEHAAAPRHITLAGQPAAWSELLADSARDT